MAFADALPSFSEIPSQLRWDSDESLVEYAGHLSLTVGMLASIGIAFASLMLIVGFGTTLAGDFLGFTIVLPVLGETMVVPGLALAGGVVASLVALRLLPVIDDKAHVQDDANAILVFNAITYFAAAFNVNLNIPNSVSFAFVLVGLTFATMYLVEVVMSRR